MEQMHPTQKRIFMTALDLFASVGYRNSSMRAIADTVGIKSSSIYNYYGSKEEILHEVLAVAQRSIMQTQTPIEEILELARIKSIGQLLFSMWQIIQDETECKILRVLQMLYYERMDLVSRRTYLDEPMRYFQLVFSALIEAGRLPPFDYNPVCFMMLSYMYTTFSSCVISGLSYEECVARHEKARQELAEILDNDQRLVIRND